jgi:hypothetical protein
MTTKGKPHLSAGSAPPCRLPRRSLGGRRYRLVPPEHTHTHTIKLPYAACARPSRASLRLLEALFLPVSSRLLDGRAERAGEVYRPTLDVECACSHHDGADCVHVVGKACLPRPRASPTRGLGISGGRFPLNQKVFLVGQKGCASEGVAACWVIADRPSPQPQSVGRRPIFSLARFS